MSPFPFGRRWLIAASAAPTLLAGLLLSPWRAVDARFTSPAVPVMVAGLVTLLFVKHGDQARLIAGLRQSEQRLRSVADASESGILLFTADGWLTFTNGRWAELTGTILSPPNGRRWLEGFGSADRGRLLEAWRHSLATGQRVELRLPYRRADATEGLADVSMHFEGGHEDDPAHLVVRLTDRSIVSPAEAQPIDRQQLHPPLAAQSRTVVVPLGGDGTQHQQPRAKAVGDFDRERLAELRAVLGPDRINQLLSLFGRELAARPATIRDAIGRSDLAAAASEAHSLRGAALSIGGRSVGHAAAVIEDVLVVPAPRQAERLHDSLRELDRAVASTIAVLPQEMVATPARAA